MADVSVIIPVYNVKPYIRRSVASVLNQTLRDIEVILVDDGSTDGCGKICDELADGDSRVRVLHQENRGLSAARNAGMESARGKYLFFCDPDDLMKKNLLEDNFRLAEIHQADMVVFGHGRINSPDIDPEAVPAANLPVLEGVFTPSQLRRRFREAVSASLTVWTRLYRRSFLEENHVRFTNQRVVEDAVFNLTCMGLSFSRIVFHRRAYYCYLIRRDSIMGQYQPEMFACEQKVAETLKQVVRTFPGWPDEYRGLVAYFYIRAVNITLGNMAEPSCPLTRRGKLNKLKEMMAVKEIQAAVAEAPMSYFQGARDRIKFLLLKHRQYRLILRLGEWKKRALAKG